MTRFPITAIGLVLLLPTPAFAEPVVRPVSPTGVQRGFDGAVCALRTQKFVPAKVTCHWRIFSDTTRLNRESRKRPCPSSTKSQLVEIAKEPRTCGASRPSPDPLLHCDALLWPIVDEEYFLRSLPIARTRQWVDA
jgi:hypothetical protein